MFTTLAEEEMKKMIKTLKAFKNGDLNIIVSTSVLEEGVDIRICNLVIRFDKPKTFRPYVQSRGRARAKESNYILFKRKKGKREKRKRGKREKKERREKRKERKDYCVQIKKNRTLITS